MYVSAARRGLFRIYGSCMFVSCSFLYYYSYNVSILSSVTNAFKSFFLHAAVWRLHFDVTFSYLFNSNVSKVNVCSIYVLVQYLIRQ